MKGFAGAIFKGFPSYEEAARWYAGRAGTFPLPPAPSPSEGEGENQPALSASSPSRGVREKRQAPPSRSLYRGEKEAKPTLPLGTETGVIIYTDGSSRGNPGPGGWAAVIVDGGLRRELSGGYRRTTNNRMELLACIQALESLDAGREVTLHSDSSYVVNGVERGWARRWRANGWMRARAARAENADLWGRLLDQLDRHAVHFVWLRGHAGYTENERCDRLAVAAASAPNLPPDPGFQG